MRNVSAHTGKLSFSDAKKLEKNGSRLITAQMAEKLMVEPARAGDSMLAIGKFWTGTIVAYPKANLPFSYEVQVPNRPLIFLLDTSDFRGEKNLALVFSEFEVHEDGRQRIYVPKEVVPLAPFPQESGWCSLHESGVPIKNGKYGHYLWRWDGERVGPLVRAFGKDGSDVFIHHRPSEKLQAIFAQSALPEQKADVIPILAASRK
jgi:hypothetical protein